MPPTKATSTAAPSRTFEVHRKAGDRWVVDSIADDKQIAIRMANALLKAGRARGGVKVIAVTESADGEFRESQIYQATPESQAAAPVQASVAAAPAAAKPKIRIERAKPEAASASAAKAAANKKRGGSSIGWPGARTSGRSSWHPRANS